MILTRYLYPKHNVIYSLYVSLAISELEQSLFWAYELYFSGFRTETVELLLEIYENYYINEPIKPAFKKWLNKNAEKWRQDMQPEIVATIIQNMVRREPDGEKFREKIPDFIIPKRETPYSQKPIFIVSKQTPPEYQTKLAEYTKGWKLPPIVCEYISYCDPTIKPIQISDYVENQMWLYYASGSPIWRTHIKKYGGKIDDNNMCVKFSSHEIEVEFLNWFDMEPDEQPLDVKAAWIGEPW